MIERADQPARETSRQRLLAALRGGEHDRIAMAPDTTGRVPLDSVPGREVVARTDPLLDLCAGL